MYFNKLCILIKTLYCKFLIKCNVINQYPISGTFHLLFAVIVDSENPALIAFLQTGHRVVLDFIEEFLFNKVTTLIRTVPLRMFI